MTAPTVSAGIPTDAKSRISCPTCRSAAWQRADFSIHPHETPSGLPCDGSPDPNAPTIAAQQARARALLTILGTPGLMPAAWNIEPESEQDSDPGLRGQFDGVMPLWQAHAEIGAYASAFKLEQDKDRLVVPAAPGASAWVLVRARGFVNGVAVQVLGRGKPEASLAVAA